MRNLPLILLLITALSCTKMGTGEDPTVKSITANDGLPTWTIMVYMNGDNSLSNYTDLDIAEMSKIDFKGNVNVIVLLDKKYSTTKLLKLNYQNPYLTNNPAHQVLTATINGKYLSPNTPQELDMLSEVTLSDFVNFAKTNYPANNYALIFWSHSDGWRTLAKGIQADDDNGKAYGSLTNKKMATALSGKYIDVIMFDSCLQGSLETIWAFKIQNAAKFLVASPNTVPGYGNDYEKFLSGFMDSSRTMYDMAGQFIQTYATIYKNTLDTSMTAYYLPNFDPTVFTNFFTWLYSLDANIDPLIKKSEYTLFNTLPDIESGYTGVKNIYDYITISTYPSKNIILSMLDNVIYKGWKQSSGSYKGLTIYSPYNTSNYIYDYPTYIQNDLSLDTVWDDVISKWHGY